MYLDLAIYANFSIVSTNVLYDCLLIYFHFWVALCLRIAYIVPSYVIVQCIKGQ